MTPSAVSLLYVLAFVCFIAGVVDHPRVSGVRCIALGLALTALAFIISRYFK